jgi:hypothetical protein
VTLVGTQGEAAPSAALDERLSLAGSGLCDADVQGLAATLQAPEWQGLTALDLSANRLTDRGCAVLGPAIAAARSAVLRSVDLRGNAGISAQGAQAPCGGRGGGGREGG